MAAQSHEPEPVVHEYLWPCNVAVWDIWCDLQSQWCHGMAGPTGLNYAGVRAHLDELGLAPGEERSAVYAGIRAAERATLEACAELAEQEQDRTPH